MFHSKNKCVVFVLTQYTWVTRMGLLWPSLSSLCCKDMRFRDGRLHVRLRWFSTVSQCAKSHVYFLSVTLAFLWFCNKYFSVSVYCIFLRKGRLHIRLRRFVKAQKVRKPGGSKALLLLLLFFNCSFQPYALARDPLTGVALSRSLLKCANNQLGTILPFCLHQLS